MLFVKLETPPGSSLAVTDEIVRKAEALIRIRPEVVNFYSAVGGFEGGEVNSAMMFVTLDTLRKRKPGPGLDGKTKVWTQQELSGMVSTEFQKFPASRPSSCRISRFQDSPRRADFLWSLRFRVPNGRRWVRSARISRRK